LLEQSLQIRRESNTQLLVRLAHSPRSSKRAAELLIDLLGHPERRAAQDRYFQRGRLNNVRPRGRSSHVAKPKERQHRVNAAVRLHDETSTRKGVNVTLAKEKQRV
jgi:hypothetical protein